MYMYLYVKIYTYVFIYIYTICMLTHISMYVNVCMYIWIKIHLQFSKSSRESSRTALAWCQSQYNDFCT